MRADPRPFRLALLLAAVLAGVFVVSAFLAAVISQGLAGSEATLAGLILDKGEPKLMRRVMMVLIIPFIPMLLRLAGWRGWRDTGQSADPARLIDAAWRTDLAIGLGIGLVSLGIMDIIALAAGTRTWAAETSAGGAAVILAGSAVSAVVIGWTEETAVRGILFRSLQRVWSLAPAVLVSSLLFSILHFLKASQEAFGDGSVFTRTGAAILSALGNPARTSEFLPRFLNLTLMGVVLCLFVYRTRTIWVAAGTHAAWVWLHRLNELYTDAVPDTVGPWLGNRSDSTDSLLTVLMFILLAWLGARFLPVRGPREAS